MSLAIFSYAAGGTPILQNQAYVYLSRASKVEERETIQGNLVAAVATLGSRIPRDPRARIA